MSFIFITKSLTHKSLWNLFGRDIKQTTLLRQTVCLVLEQIDKAKVKYNDKKRQNKAGISINKIDKIDVRFKEIQLYTYCVEVCFK